MDMRSFQWTNRPRVCSVDDRVAMVTEPGTDLWQKTYYGFMHDNAHLFTVNVAGDFTFSAVAAFDMKNLFDQCGIILYHDSENWLKASLEYQDPQKGTLGSVVTSLGYSDWASTEIPLTDSISYRLSRRGQDFYIEYAVGGGAFKQMRILHMHHPIDEARVGVYACSPLDHGFSCEFSNLKLSSCEWAAFSTGK